MAGAAAAPWLGWSPGALARAADSAPVRPYSLDDLYAERVETYDAALSPDGGRIAVLRIKAERVAGAPKPIISDKGAREARPGEKGEADELAEVAYVDLIDAAQPDRVQKVIRIGPHIVRAVEWGSEDRLLIWVSQPSPHPLAVLMGKDAGMFAVEARRLLSIGADGTDPVVLFNDRNMLATVYDLATVVDYLPNNPEHVMMAAWDPRTSLMALWRVNIVTGEATAQEMGRYNTVGWFVDGGQAVLRLDMNRKGTVQRVYARPPGGREWKFVRRTRTDQAPDFFYIGRGQRPGVILAGARVEGEDTISVRELDLATLEFGPPLHSRAGADATGSLIDERGQLIGVRYMEDRVAYDFMDPGMAAHFRSINAYLGDERNVTIFDVDAARNRMIAYASGPRDPGQHVFYDKAARRLVDLGARHPELKADRFGKAEALTVTTRDGARISAYLTAPPGGKPGPLVVYPHGGPELRDYLDYDRRVQILAAQGWWVLQPNFRGSGGFGQAFVAAGNRRWGDRMQEDVEDALAHVVGLGKVDHARVAIMGISYGGYAALMGAVRKPDLYRACVAIAGVSDLPVMLKSEKKDDEDGYNYWVRTIGDPRSDRAMLEAASPARRAAEVRAPVMLIHGGADRIVLPEQSRLMAAALKAAGREHEHIEVPGAGHATWSDAKDRELMEKVIAFLGRAFA